MTKVEEALAQMEQMLEKPQQLVTATNYHDVVAVALAFRPAGISDDELLNRIMRALRGMSNPKAMLDEIKRQRHGYDQAEAIRARGK